MWKIVEECRQPGCLTTHQVLSYLKARQVLSYPKASILSSTASLVKLSPRVPPMAHFFENVMPIFYGPNGP